jgi:nitrile hydratase accessory protein
LTELGGAIRPLARDSEGPIFNDQWEAQAFAMIVALHEAKLFSWSEWTTALGREIASGSRSGEPDDSYYRHWLSALEGLVVEKGAASRSMLTSRKAAWARAAHATPHGEPIVLENDPEASAKEQVHGHGHG